MSFTKEVEIMNRYLERDYGYFEATYPLYRISWSENQFEKRIVQHDIHGIELLHPQVVEKPKYSQWIHNKYILERLIPVPSIADLVEKISYEPVFVFEDKDGIALPPNYDVCKIVIASIQAAAAVRIGAKYQDPRANPDFKESERARLKELQEQLFGNETSVTDALAHGSGVSLAKSEIH